MTEEKQPRWKRYNYPWESLKQIGDFFKVPDEIKTIRQLVFAANKRSAKTGMTVAYFRTEEGQFIRRVG